ncbi:MAG: PhoH family protein [Maricaulaceae bacterium]
MEHVHAHTSQFARSERVELTPRAFHKISAGGNRLIQHIETELRPFRVHIDLTGEVAEIIGDDVAVTLASKILAAICDEGVSDRQGEGDEKGRSVEATTAWVIDDALKRDLAFRLSGITLPVRPMCLSQVAFMKLLLSPEAPLVFGIGPTGTGKTRLAIAAALNQLAEEHVKHVVISRPHVLTPGETMTPELRAETGCCEQFMPIHDAMHDLIGIEEAHALMEHEKLIVTPLGRMRGRTFNDSFIIIDDAQNISARLLRMAVTRMGQGSRLVITGDPTQSELIGDEPSGLPHLLELLEGSGLAHVHEFATREIVRNDLVARIETLYARERSAEAQIAA